MRSAVVGMATVALFGFFTLAGCASSGLIDAATGGASPLPTPACVDSDTESVDGSDCPKVDSEHDVQENKTFKDRKTPTAADQAILNQALAAAEAALQAIAAPIPTAEHVKETLTAEGFTAIDVVGDPATGVGFWAEVQMSGCLFGEIVPSAGLTIEAGGFIADGGCRALSGH
ncbi:MAG: hypothetical protein ACOH1K_02225 [Rhodoglobus sp.]